MKLQLSISLLASDKPAALERCLNSLKPLLAQVLGELIVVVTGTDPHVREIASRYTDQIIPFTWCDDFAAARNIGLQKSKGEWFLYIDDDEWFEDVQEICDFFTSGEYRNYGCAYYKQRNYLDWYGVKRSDFSAFRMTRRTPKLKFYGKIHEELKPALGPIKKFESHVNHYGYVTNKGKEDSGKPSRNIPLLLQSIKEQPSYLKNYVQLTQEYCVLKQWKNAEKYCVKGRKLRRKQDESVYRGWLQVYLVNILYMQDKNEKTKETAESILETEETCELTRLEFYTILIILYGKEQLWEKVLDYGKKFRDTLNYMDSKPYLWKQQNYGDITEKRIKSLDRLFMIYKTSIEAALELNNLEEAETFIGKLPWDNEREIQPYYPVFDEWKEKYDPKFQKLLTKCTYENPYILLQKYTSEEKSLIKCIMNTDSLYLQQQIIKEAFLNELDLKQFTNKISLDIWKQCTCEIINELSLNETEHMLKAAESLRESAEIHWLWVKKLLREKELLQGYYSEEKLMATLTDYADSTLAFYKEQYQERFFVGEHRTLLSVDCQFAMIVKEALENIANGAYLEALQLFRSGLQIYIPMTGTVQEVVRQLSKQLNNPAQNAGEEFQLLAQQMKKTLASLIQQEQYTEAMSVITQLIPLLPEDLGLLRMKQMVLRKLTDEK